MRIYPEVFSGVCKIVSFPTSRAVFLDNTPFIVEGDSLERERTRQDDNSGVYNGDPGLGFNSPRYYVNKIQEQMIRSSLLYFP